MTAPKRFTFGMLAAALLGATLAGPIGARAARPPALDPDVVRPGGSGRAIVGFRHDVDAATIARLSRAGITAAVVIDTIDAVGVIGSRDAYATIAEWSDVSYVDDDSPIRFDNFGAKKDTRVTTTRAGARPLKKRYTGKGVTVAVVDTGIDSSHPDLADRVVQHVNFEPSWFFDMIEDGVYSDQLSEATGNPIDSYGHGTHVAGIVAGTGAGGQGEDFSGVAPEASLVNIKIADLHQGVTCDVPCDLGWEINALVAYEWLIENRNNATFPGGIRVATNSWSIYEVDSEVEPITLIVQAAFRMGIVNVFAAGNAGPDDNTVALGPNSVEESITVGATCKVNGYESNDTCTAGNIAEFSSRGKQVDVSAPGVGIWSTMARPSAYGPLGMGIPPPGTDEPAEGLNNAALYTALSGTSMATPHVAGVVALMLQANPKLKPAEVEQILVSTAKDKGGKGFDRAFGYGLVDAYRAAMAAEAKGVKKPATRRR